MSFDEHDYFQGDSDIRKVKKKILKYVMTGMVSNLDTKYYKVCLVIV